MGDEGETVLFAYGFVYTWISHIVLVTVNSLYMNLSNGSGTCHLKTGQKLLATVPNPEHTRY
jgi:hypothetical protein